MALGGFDSLREGLPAALGGLVGGGLGGRAPATSVEFEELDGNQRRKIKLKGRAMPYRGVEWPIEMRSKITWYPGNPVATQQILGPEELPTMMEGTWKDRFIKGSVVVDGNDREIDTAEKCMLLFAELARSARLLRVQWGPEIRSGIIKRFTPTYERLQDIEWKIEFEWQSRNDEITPRAAQEQTPASSVFNLMNFIDDLVALVADANDLVNAAVAGIVSTIDRVREQVSGLFQLLRVAETLVSLPATLLGAIRSAVDSLSRELTDLLRQLTGSRSTRAAGPGVTGSAVNSTSQGLNASGAAPASSAVTQEIDFEVFRRTLAASAAQLRFTVQRIGAEQSARAQPRTIRVVTARQGESIYDLARRFYGSADYANFIAATNGLNSANIVPGTQIRIAPRPFSAAASQEACG